MKAVDRILLSLAAMASGIVLSEMVHHYSLGLPTAQEFLNSNLLFFGNQTANGYFSLDWYIIIMLIPFIGLKYMRWNKLLFAVITFLAASTVVWIVGDYVHIYLLAFSDFSKSIALIPAIVFNKKGA